MDLAAYMQIEDLEGVMKANGISVPRLRGLCLMGNEVPLSKNDIDVLVNEQWLWECEKLCCSGFKLNSDSIVLDDDIDSMTWLRNLIHAYEKMCKDSGYVGLTDKFVEETNEDS